MVSVAPTFAVPLIAGTVRFARGAAVTVKEPLSYCHALCVTTLRLQVSTATPVRSRTAVRVLRSADTEVVVASTVLPDR